MLRPPVLITAGPTFEDIDEVRFIGNRSSGRMGLALAEAVLDRGWDTTIALGPMTAPPSLPPSARVLRFRSTADLERLLAEQWPRHRSLIMAAAVADYRPATPASGKMRRQRGGLTLELEPTPDLLAACGRSRRPDQYIVGFALEPRERLIESARSKLARKHLDAIVANPLETMDAATVSATVIHADRPAVEIPEMTKTDFARRLIALLAGDQPGAPEHHA
jgi:phosphopantothenoylcysteine decarboxylase/phosphopantothenate--cysteine ligase